MADDATYDILALTTSTFGLELLVDGNRIGRFMEVEGLSLEMKVEQWKEGGRNGFTHVLPGPVEYQNLVLKRGVIDGNELFKWFDKAASTPWADKKSGLKRDADILLTMYGFGVGSSQDAGTEFGGPVRSWGFRDALPVKWEGPKFNAGSDDLATETLHIAHHGFYVWPGD